MPKRDYTLSQAARAQRARAASRPRGGGREWTTVRVDAELVAKIDARRGDLSRNDYLHRVVR